MEFLIYGYIIVGMIVALVIWYAAFDREYDTWHRDTYKEEPPNVGFKLWAVAMAPIMWPVYLYWIVR